MEEKRNYVVYSIIDNEEVERVVLMTKEKADAIRWFLDKFEIDGCVELAEDYKREEI